MIPLNWVCFSFFVLQWATVRMERGAKEKNHLLYKPYSLNSKWTLYNYTYGKYLLFLFAHVLVNLSDIACFGVSPVLGCSHRTWLFLSVDQSAERLGNNELRSHYLCPICLCLDLLEIIIRYMSLYNVFFFRFKDFIYLQIIMEIQLKTQEPDMIN